MSAHPDVLPRYLNSIVSKEGFGVCLSCQVKDRRFAPAVCSSHQQSISPVFTVGVTLSKDICHKKNFSHLHSYFITICLCLLRCFVDNSECASFCFPITLSAAVTELFLVLTKGKLLILGLLHTPCRFSFRLQSCHLFQNLTTCQRCRNCLGALKD